MGHPKSKNLFLADEVPCCRCGQAEKVLLQMKEINRGKEIDRDKVLICLDDRDYLDRPESDEYVYPEDWRAVSLQKQIGYELLKQTCKPEVVDRALAYDDKAGREGFHLVWLSGSACVQEYKDNDRFSEIAFSWFLAHELQHVVRYEDTINAVTSFLRCKQEALGLTEIDVPAECDAERVAWDVCYSLFCEEAHDFVSWAAQNHPRCRQRFSSVWEKGYPLETIPDPLAASICLLEENRDKFCQTEIEFVQRARECLDRDRQDGPPS